MAATSFDAFLERLMLDGLEYFRRYYGVYRAEVTDNRDPEERGRIKAVVPEVGHREAPEVWIDPAFPGAGTNRGFFFPPEIGDSVRVSFEAGDPSRPIIYWGGWFGRNEVPAEFGYGPNDYPEKRGIRTRSGHHLVFNDQAGEEAVELVWRVPSEDLADRTKTSTAPRYEGSLKIDKNGNVELRDREAQRVTLDPVSKRVEFADGNGNSITMDSSGITLKANAIFLGDGADTQALRYSDWLQMFAQHVHGTGVGNSGPPVVPPPNSVASTVVKLK